MESKKVIFSWLTWFHPHRVLELFSTHRPGEAKSSTGGAKISLRLHPKRPVGWLCFFWRKGILPNMLWMVATQICFYFHPYLGKFIFQVGWNHQLDVVTSIYPELFAWTRVVVFIFWMGIGHKTGLWGRWNPCVFFQVWMAQPPSHIRCPYIYIYFFLLNHLIWELWHLCWKYITAY